MKFVNFIIFITMLLFVTGCDKKSDNEEKVDIKTEKEAVLTQDYTAPFSLHFTDGTILKMQKNKNGFKIDNNGTATLFAFFSPWCPPCQVQSPILNNIQENFKEKLQVIGVLVGENLTNDDAKVFAIDNNVTYKISQGSENNFFANALGGVSEVPFIVIYDEKGRFFSQYFGIIPEEILTTEIQRIF
ncbi:MULTISPECIES: TlpA family protein disulfide reductase [unclassified Campylobacter]|uniref:TlpA family protein disulfide reductase n=1 Tax=unclassified Campylobacter TaxID=2593542 RepID=UPI001B09661D|nr:MULTISPECIES: TlpA disulfide reductase family protein [unclassified Campylobacter]MBO7476153.1 TlpA family protein disulfide reductase [Campylobacter sp.]MBR2156683.1 TlpA family protein disulfide reductase [Campylobacter sp.]MDA3055568.1 TlpA family protein disulfide reductase [Campylobacter sp. CN_NA1]MDA3064742.1 TlpA family protein disulfide reductase [Campylobacter sp. CN_NE4]MDA3068434.1 TlpA family protein disulfide reductase [Campylobacter sp. CN_NE3]